ncbi:hypothetical protein V7S43_004947 [Phytophthora oleae]|uniref:Uncharacterized protein n=1 Tax=Phytophthora oleae TaxID=2107226 RepID=A0ABD3FV56_9STRA
MPTSSKKLLRTVDPQERQRIATPLNSARTTPANTTPAVTRTPAPTPVITRTPVHELQGANTSPHLRPQGQVQSPPLARVLFPDLRDDEAISARGVSQRPIATSSCHTAPTRTASPAPPIVSRVSGEIRQQALLADNTVDTLAAELDTVALNNRQLDEYLEHFDWEEIGDYGDEATVGTWSSILNTPRISTSSSSNGSGDADPTTGADENARNAAEDTTTPFTTTRIGSHADPIPAPNRQSYPQNNDPSFPQEKRLSGIRSRKTSLALLVVDG